MCKKDNAIQNEILRISKNLREHQQIKFIYD